MTATQEELPALVESALAIVDVRLSGSGGTGLYDSIRNQILWIREALGAPNPPAPARVDALLLGVYAARELETTDPELANLLFDIEYLVVRRWPAPPQPDLAPLLTERIKRPGWRLLILTVVLLVGSLGMGALAVLAPEIRLTGRIALMLFALLGLGATIWLIVLFVTGARRAANLLDLVEHHPERVERIYAGHVRNVGNRSARMEPVPMPESEHMGDGTRGWYVLVTRKDPTSVQRIFGLNFDSIHVGRDEVLPMLNWLRSKVPDAAGPRDSAGPRGGTT